ncbi:dihydrodipicolinate synthase family protein [Pediococcus argentinicus]|uniref:dihydrodipicolinate synthase family protein n=1 Tax=Pediococcus argentinicus TaxID=480391 RepID=UPI00338D5C6F
MTLKNNFHISVPTAFDNQDETLNIGATLDHIHNLADKGIKSVLVSGSNGEQHSMTTDEKIQLIDAIQADEEWPAEFEFIFGLSNVRLSEAVKLASAIAKSDKIKAALIGFPPYILPTQEEAVSYVKTILTALDGKDAILYNNPKRTGFDLDLDSIVELAKSEQVIGLKEAGNPQKVVDLHDKLEKDFLYFIGGESNILTKRAVGFNAMSSVLGNLDPELFQFYFESLSDEDVDNDDKRAIQQRINKLARAVRIPQMKRLITEDENVDMGVGRAPLGM